MAALATERYRHQAHRGVASAHVPLPTDAEPMQSMAMPARDSEWTLEMLHALPSE
jgi:hypothetical protein